MEILILSAVAGLAVLAGYVWAVAEKYGIPASVSETYYALERPKAFTACMAGAALLTLPAALEASGENSEFLIFLSVIGMVMVGLFPHFKTYEKGLHYTGAGLLFACSQAWVAANAPGALLLWVPLLAWLAVQVKRARADGAEVMRYLAKGHAMFWAEVTLMATTYLCVMANLR